MAARKIVVIGAGIAGTGVADELTQLGQKDVTVIDQGPLFKTGGATSHAPGLITRTSASRMMHLMADYTIEKLMSFDLDGLPCYLPVGAIELAQSEERLNYLIRRSEYALSWGFEGRILSSEECAQLHPLLDPSSFIGGYHTTREGIGKALRGAEAQARRAMANGAKFIGDTRVLAIETQDSHVTGVRTSNGVIPADLVVLAAGAWGRGIAATAGIVLPSVPMEHQYAITEPIAGLAQFKDGDADLPFIRHWEGGIYVRNEQDRAGIGSFEHKALPVTDALMADDNRDDPSKFPLTLDDWEDGWNETVKIMPSLANATLIDSYNGVFPYSPDGMPLLGETPGLAGLWTIECVWATHSVGAARSVAQAICGIAPDIDFAAGDNSRFDAIELEKSVYETRCDNAYVDTYAIHHPAEPSHTPRNIRASEFYQEQKALGGAFFDTSGWERPRWYECNQQLADQLAPINRDAWSSQHWSPIIAAEHLQVRKTAGVFDMTSLRRITVTGKDAAQFLSSIAAKSVDKAVGSVTYTMLLEPTGGIVSDVTICRISQDEYLVGGNSQRDTYWLQSLSADYDVMITDITMQTNCIAVWGPVARELLAPLTGADISHEAFPYFTCQQIDIDGIAVTAVRVSYVGELGWELTVDNAHAVALWKAIMNRANEVGAIPAGRGALTSLRIEKGYRAWGTDMSREDTPSEAGLTFAVAKTGDNVGLAASRRPDRRHLRTLKLADTGIIPTVGQPVRSNGSIVGYITSCEYGWSVGYPVAYAWLNPSAGTHVEVLCAGEVVPGEVVADCVFDPQGSRIRV